MLHVLHVLTSCAVLAMPEAIPRSSAAMPEVGTAANVADVTQVDKLLHGAESYVSGDSGYTGAAKRPEHAERDVIWSIAARPSSYKHHGKGSVL